MKKNRISLIVLTMLVTLVLLMTSSGDGPYHLDRVCSEDGVICKEVWYIDEGGDGHIEVGEEIMFYQIIEVYNPTETTWSDVMVEDRFGAEIEVVEIEFVEQGVVELTTKGSSDKVFLTWDIGVLLPEETAILVMVTRTDTTPGGDQSYTECSYHEYNSGAVVKFNIPSPSGKPGKMQQQSYGTGEIIASVLTVDLAGDCDGDGYTDAEELVMGTDPHVFNDRVLIYYGNEGYESHDLLKAHYETSGYIVEYTDAWPSTLIFPGGTYALVFISCPGWGGDDNFTTGQKNDLIAYMAAGGRVVVAGDHSGLWGINTLNNLVGTLSGNIVQNADAVTPNGDVCPPLTEITPDPVTQGLIDVDPSATSSLTVSGPAISLVRIDPSPYHCVVLGDATNGETVIARDGRLVVMGDSNIVDDFGLDNLYGDGDNYGLADNLVLY